MTSLQAVETENVPLFLQLGDFAEDKFVRAYVLPEDGSATPLAEVDLPHVLSGFYCAPWQVPSPDKFVVVFRVFDSLSPDVASADYDAAAPLVIEADIAETQPLQLVGSAVDPTLLP